MLNLLPNLLRQRVSIRDAVGILEPLGEAAPIEKAILLLTEYVRHSCRRRVVRHLFEPSRDQVEYLLDSLRRPRDMVAA